MLAASLSDCHSYPTDRHSQSTLAKGFVFALQDLFPCFLSKMQIGGSEDLIRYVVGVSTILSVLLGAEGLSFLIHNA